jgi:thioredoxin 1
MFDAYVRLQIGRCVRRHPAASNLVIGMLRLTSGPLLPGGAGKKCPAGGRMASNAIVEVTDANFDQLVLKSDQPVIVDFWATWCGPCRALAPIVDEVAQSYTGRVKVGKMDVDKNAATPQRYGVRGIPTLLVFKDGQVKEQIVGYVSRDVIEKALDKNL